MCGRFSLFSDGSELARLFNCGADEPLSPRYNIAPGQPVRVVRHPVRSGGSARQLVLIRWGLIPSWASDASMAYKCINARSETVADKPAFRSAFRHRRCLIPANGFFEWQKRGKVKQPFLFQLTGQHLFAFAGLWECWSGPHGDGRETCTILTTEANELVRPLHERMPVILPEEYHSDWLDAQATAPEWLQTVLRSYPAEAMQAVPVSSWVNDGLHEGPECVRPAG